MMMMMMRPLVTSKILGNVYDAIIYPFLLYGIMIWGNASLTLLNPIHIPQKKFVRMATYKDGYPLIPGPLSHLFFINWGSLIFLTSLNFN